MPQSDQGNHTTQYNVSRPLPSPIRKFDDNPSGELTYQGFKLWVHCDKVLQFEGTTVEDRATLEKIGSIVTDKLRSLLNTDKVDVVEDRFWYIHDDTVRTAVLEAAEEVKEQLSMTASEPDTVWDEKEAAESQWNASTSTPKSSLWDFFTCGISRK